MDLVSTWKSFLICLLLVQVGSSQSNRGDLGSDNDRPMIDAVQDENPITIPVCPSDITVTMEPCERSDVIEISWDEPTAVSSNGPVTLVSRTVQPGAVFRAGEETVVEYVYEDGDGNQATCSFIVSIIRAPSKCFITHGPHFVTFDSFQYGFLSDCMHTIIQNCGTDSDLPNFKVTGDFIDLHDNQERFALREIRLLYQNNEFILREGRRVYVNGMMVTYPLVNFNGVSIYWNHPHNILLTDFGLSIKFDGEKDAEIFLKSTQTVCGLCGTNDFDPLNDKHLPNGDQVSSVTEFVDAWSSVSCPGNSTLIAQCEGGSSGHDYAVQQCGAIYNTNDGPFLDCYLHVSEVPLYESCVENSCAFPEDATLPCDYYEHFTQMCNEAGVMPLDWREGIPPDCSLICPVETELTTCTSACPPTCAEPNGPEVCDLPCIEACVCTEGKVLDGDQCVDPSECGCLLETGEYVSSSQTWTSSDCTLHCFCDSGTFECRNMTCNENADCVIDRSTGTPTCQCHEGLNGNGEICVGDFGYCLVWGDPHYLTFDGRSYSFQGKCRYTIAKTCVDSDLPEFHLIGDNVRQSPELRVSFQRILFLIYNGHEYTIKRKYVAVDGVKVTLPLLDYNGVTVHFDAPYTVMETDFGLRIRYNQRSETEIYISNEYASLLCGLCGNFDGNKKNDLTRQDGRRTGRPNVFARTWLVSGDPDCVEDEETTEEDEDYEEDPCQFAASSDRQYASQLCQILSPDDDTFASCHQVADSTMYYESCIYDLCATLPDENVLCESVEEYLVSCKEAGGVHGA